MISFWKTKLSCRYKLGQSCKLFLCARRNLLIFRNWGAWNFVPISSGTISIKTLTSEEQLHTVNFLSISTRDGSVQIHTIPFQAIFFHLCECLEIAQKNEFICVLIRLLKACRSVMRTYSSVTRKYCLKVFLRWILYYIFFSFRFSNFSRNFGSASIAEVVSKPVVLAEVNHVSLYFVDTL